MVLTGTSLMTNDDEQVSMYLLATGEFFFVRVGVIFCGHCVWRGLNIMYAPGDGI